MARESSIARRGFGRIERRESGRYRAAYTGPDGRLYRAPTTFDAKEDAVAWPWRLGTTLTPHVVDVPQLRPLRDVNE
jgi:hypothetical protein